MTVLKLMLLNFQRCSSVQHQTFYECFFAMPVAERKRIAEEAGLSFPYLLKQTYVKGGEPRFQFSNAVALDKASGGRLSMFDITEGAPIDWEYVAKRMRQHKRNATRRAKKAAA